MCPSPLRAPFAQPCSLPLAGSNRAYGTYTVYSKDMFCGSPASDFDLDPIVTHSAVVSSLAPGQLYYYQ